MTEQKTYSMRMAKAAHQQKAQRIQVVTVR